MKIAICDDAYIERMKLEEVCSAYIADRQIDCAIVKFSNGNELVASIREGTKYSVILMDIQMPAISGMTASKIIRTMDSDVEIIFVTALADVQLAADGYLVGAARYILKPYRNEQIWSALDACLISKRTCSDIITIKNNVDISINIDNIMYAMSNDKKVNFHLKDGSVVPTYGRLDDIFDTTKMHNFFCRCHKSYLVNLNYVKEYTPSAFIMTNGMSIPIPKTSTAKVRKEYYDYIFCKK